MITQVLSHSVIHALVYAPVEARKHWVQHELNELRADTTMQVASSVREVVAVLVEDSRARPQVLVIDVDALDAGELFHLHEVRERGWCGEIIAIGTVPPSLAESLKIDLVMKQPLAEHALSDELVRYRCATEERTMPCPIITD